MLKIKDEIPLKELEKLGFSQSLKSCYTKDIDSSVTCFINIDDRHIWFGCGEVISQLDMIYDLIEFGYVEKVVD